MLAVLHSLLHNKVQNTVFSPKGKSTKPVSLSTNSVFFDANFCFPSLPPIKKVWVAKDRRRRRRRCGGGSFRSNAQREVKKEAGPIFGGKCTNIYVKMLFYGFSCPDKSKNNGLESWNGPRIFVKQGTCPPSKFAFAVNSDLQANSEKQKPTGKNHEWEIACFQQFFPFLSRPRLSKQRL